MEPTQRDRNVALAAELLDQLRRKETPTDLIRNPRVAAVFASMGSSFSDAELTVESVTADDERVVVCGTITGTHDGPWRDVPPSGRRISALTMVNLVCADGGIVDARTLVDSLAIAEQIGAVEPLGLKACQIYDRAVAES